MKSVIIMADLEEGIEICEKEQCKLGTVAWKAARHARRTCGRRPKGPCGPVPEGSE